MNLQAIVPIGNIPACEPVNDEIPTAQMLELYRAQRRIGELEDLLKSRDVKIEKCLELL